MASCQAQHVAEHARGSVLLLYITGYLVHSLSDIEGEFSWVENMFHLPLDSLLLAAQPGGTRVLVGQKCKHDPGFGKTHDTYHFYLTI